MGIGTQSETDFRISGMSLLALEEIRKSVRESLWRSPFRQKNTEFRQENLWQWHSENVRTSSLQKVILNCISNAPERSKRSDASYAPVGIFFN